MLETLEYAGSRDQPPVGVKLLNELRQGIGELTGAGRHRIQGVGGRLHHVAYPAHLVLPAQGGMVLHIEIKRAVIDAYGLPFGVGGSGAVGFGEEELDLLGSGRGGAEEHTERKRTNTECSTGTLEKLHPVSPHWGVE